ncbi:MAG: (deoxy)nucleoside triphosphate pyrophosphohydrolase [Syntrophomonas sp.]
MDEVTDVVAAILFKGNQVLIAQRAHSDPLAGLWEFPGGKIEAGESPEESLIREMQEEFCIDLEVGQLLASSIYPYDKGTIRLLAYICKYTGGDIHATVHNDYLWRSVKDLDQFVFAPADRPIVKKLMREYHEF